MTLAATMVHLDCIPIPTIKMLLVMTSSKKVAGTELGSKCLNIEKAGKAMCK